MYVELAFVVCPYINESKKNDGSNLAQDFFFSRNTEFSECRDVKVIKRHFV